MSIQKTPLALFAYNRPLHTQRCLQALDACFRIEECSIHIFCDGPKTAEGISEVAATRRVVETWVESHQAEVVTRETNLGLAHSIVAGVSQLCQEFGRVIVVEDDLVVSPDFLDYMLQGLDRYQDEAKVYQISGFMYPLDLPPVPDVFFLPFITTWGWGTWTRAWQIFDWNVAMALPMLSEPDQRRRFDLDGSYPYTEMLYRRLKGRNDSWGILWYAAVFSAGGLALHPRRSLVWNGGFDNSGIHSGAPSDTMQQPLAAFAEPALTHPICFPTLVEIDEPALDQVKAYLGARRRRTRPVTGILRRISRALRMNRHGSV